MRKAVSSSMAVILLAGALAGCSSGNTEQAGSASPSPDAKTGQGAENVNLRIVWWGSQTRHDRTLKAIELFEKKNPTIKISPEFSGMDGYYEKLSTQAAGGNMPDIMQIDLQYTNEFVSRKLLIDLEPYIKDGTIDVKDLDELYLNGGKVDGKLYQMPLGANSKAVSYDPEMFKQAGVEPLKPGYTWEDYFEAGRKIRQKLGPSVYMANIDDGEAFQHWLLQHGAWMYSKDNKSIGYDDKYFVEFYTMWKKYLDEGYMVPLELKAQEKGLEDSMLVQRKSPTYAFWSNQNVALEQGAGRPLELTLFPSLKDGKSGQFLKPTMFFSVTSQSKHPKEAAAFLNFITNDLEANEVLAAERGVPVSKKVREYLYPKLDGAAKKQFDFLDVAAKYAGPLYPLLPPGHGEILLLHKRMYEQIMYGKATPEEAAVKFRTEANKILSR